MASITADLKTLRQQLERAQVEVAGRQLIDSVVVWDEQNQDYVNSETSCLREDFSGLIVHLTPEPSPQEGTVGLSQNEFETLKQKILDSIPE